MLLGWRQATVTELQFILKNNYAISSHKFQFASIINYLQYNGFSEDYQKLLMKIVNAIGSMQSRVR